MPGMLSSASRLLAGEPAHGSQVDKFSGMISLKSAQGDVGALLRGFSALAQLLQHRQLISAEACRELEGRGFAVVDNCFGKDIAASLRAEVVALRDHMHANCTHLISSNATLLPKRNIFEAELLLPQTQALAPLCAQLQHDTSLLATLNTLLPHLRLDRQAVKVQWNSGGGACFPMHFDTDAAVDGRKVTLILYLNPGWTPGSGGQLRLYPFPQLPVDIEPLNDRLVLFSSQRMLHRVLPSLDERYCFTIWLSERQQPGRGSEIAAQREALRRALSRGAGLGQSSTAGVVNFCFSSGTWTSPGMQRARLIASLVRACR